MVVSLKANRKRVIAFVVLVIVIAGACLLLNRDKPDAKQEYFGGTNEERVAFLQTFGWEIDIEPAETREVMIPAEFNDVYTAYNVMQVAQGFDLKPYAGEVCTQYKYKVNNYTGETEVYATLLVYGNLIIGGDLACAEVDGFMHGFAADSARYGETGTQPPSASSQIESSAPVSSLPESSVSSVASQESSFTSQVESTAGDVVDEEDYPTD